MIQNVVATCNVGSTLFLPGLAQQLEYCEYNPARFAAVTFRLKSPRSTVLYFGSGKIVCTGAKSTMEALLATYKYVNVLKTKLQLPVHVYGFCVQNMVASASVPHTLNLERIFQCFPTEASYEPQLFPGLILRNPTLSIVFLLFKSGRIIITGAKQRETIDKAYRLIVHKVHHLPKHTEKPPKHVKSTTSNLHHRLHQQLIRDLAL
jgi:transcription initiation factor TFIID TATA-box-binding protein